MNASRPPAKWTDTFLSSAFSGVITFSSNENTSNLVRQMFAQSPSPRLILETDAPFMVPANIYGSLPEIKGRLPLCHTAMIPWTAEVVATVAGDGWDIDRVLELGKIDANSVYGI
jgi:TatD DNase family protein